MLKADAINLLGGSVASAAEAIGCTYQAVDKWPDELPPRIRDRVQAALFRQIYGQNAAALAVAAAAAINTPEARAQG